MSAPGRELPAATELERCVLSCLMQAPDYAGPLVGRLSAEDFGTEVHGEVFDLLRQRIAAGKAVDGPTLAQELEDRGLLEKLGGYAGVSDIMTAAPNPSHARHYVEVVSHKSRLRTFIRGCWDHAAKAIDSCPEEADFRVLQESMEGLLMTLQRTNETHSKGLRDGSAVAVDVIDNMKLRYANRGRILGLALGFHDIDRTVNGLQRKDFVVVCARPAMGKTALGAAFADQIAVTACNQRQVPVLMVTLEMPDDQIMERSMLGRARMNFAKGRTGMFSDAEGAVWRTAAAVVRQHSGKPAREIYTAISHAALDALEKFWAYKAEKKGFEITPAKMADAASQIDVLADAIAAIAGGQLSFYDDTNITSAQLRAVIRRWYRGLKWDATDLCPPLVVIDYIQLVKPSEKKYRGDPRLTLVEVCDTLKSTAKELGICIMGLAQIGRSAEGNKGNRPMMKDIQESGAVEQYADLIMALHREPYYQKWEDMKEEAQTFWNKSAEIRNKSKERETLKEAPWTGESWYAAQATVDILKGRNSATGRVDILFHGPQMRFTTKTPALFSNNADLRQKPRDTPEEVLFD